jgi:hypothetical protein
MHVIVVVKAVASAEVAAVHQVAAIALLMVVLAAVLAAGN